MELMDEDVKSIIAGATIGIGATLALAPGEKEKAAEYAQYLKTQPSQEQMIQGFKKRLAMPFRAWLAHKADKQKSEIAAKQNKKRSE